MSISTNIALIATALLFSGTALAAEDAISVSDLDAPSIEQVGALDSSDGGYGMDMWADAPRDHINYLLEQLPTTIESPHLRNMMARLLLSRATLPHTDTSTDEDANNFVELRLSKLLESGQDAAFSELSDAIPPHRHTDAMRRLEFIKYLRRLDRDRVCKTAREAIAKFTLPFWQKAVIVCQALEGDMPAARIGIEVLREQGALPDDAFIALLDSVDQKAQNATVTPIDSVQDQSSPLHLALASIAGALPAELPEKITTATPLFFYINSPNVAIDTRLKAAELATKNGWMDSADLARLYRSAGSEKSPPANKPLTHDPAIKRLMDFIQGREDTKPNIVPAPEQVNSIERARYYSRLYTLWSVFGEPIPPGHWFALVPYSTLSEQPMLPPAISQLIVKSAEQGHRGELVAMLISALHDHPLTALHDDTIYLVIDALRLAGLDEDARALAIEALPTL